MIARPRRSQNNPTRGGETHAPLHHPPVYSIHRFLSLALSLWLSPSRSPLPLSLLCSCCLLRAVWAGPIVSRSPTPTVQGASNSSQRFLLSEDHVKACQKNHFPSWFRFIKLIQLQLNSLTETESLMSSKIGSIIRIQNFWIWCLILYKNREFKENASKFESK